MQVKKFPVFDLQERGSGSKPSAPSIFNEFLDRQHTKAKFWENAHLPELELEAALLVEYLDPVIVGVRHDDVVLGVHRHTTRLCELALCKIKSYLQQHKPKYFRKKYKD
jgi:hypothetical protein